MPGAYLIIGIPGSGRREVLFNLISEGIDSGEPCDIFVSEPEPDSPFDEQLAALGNVDLINWDGIDANSAPSPGAESTVFFLLNTTRDFRDQLEAFKAWLKAYRLELSRVMVVVDCQLAETQPALDPWHEAAIHFADAVLLNRRENVSNKWIRNFQLGFEKRYFPCLFTMVKKGKLDQPLTVLDDEPRRISHFFDETDIIEDMNWDEDELPDEPVDLTPQSDPYLARLPSGQFEQTLPHIPDYLSQGE